MDYAQFIRHYISGNAQFIAQYSDGVVAGDSVLITDIDTGNVDSATSTVINASSSTPAFECYLRSGAHAFTSGWRHFSFAVENVEGKNPTFKIDWTTRNASYNASWYPVYTTDYVNWVQADSRTTPGDGFVHFSFPGTLPSGRVYIHSSPTGTYQNSVDYAAYLLSNYPTIAAPVASADSSGVYTVSIPINDDIGRAVGGNNQYGIKLSFPGPTTDAGRKRKLLMLAGIHAAGENHSWPAFTAGINWILESSSQEAVDFRANWDVYLYFLVNVNGVKGGASRADFSGSFDPNRQWSINGVSDDVTELMAVIPSDTGGSVDAYLGYHGDVSVYNNFGFGCHPNDVNSGTRSVEMQALIDHGTIIFAEAPLLQGPNAPTDVKWIKDNLAAKVSANPEIATRYITLPSWYVDLGEKWIQTVQAVDADGLFVQPDPGIINCAPATITVTGQLAQVILSAGSSNTINTTPAAITVQGVTATIISGGSIPEPPPVNTNYQSWLNDPSAIRCILVEVQAKSGSSEVNRFLSSRPFKSASTDIPANTVYSPIVVGSSVRTVERLEITSNAASISFGDIEMDNHDGSIDSWLSDIWSNRAIRVYLGDVRWSRAEFQPVFDGVVEDIGSRSRTTLNLKLRDKLQRLNTPVTEVTLGGSTNNKNQLLPLLFGECHNITPLLTNPATLEYQVHNGIIERIVEIRDNGVPVSGVATLSTGKFTLPPNGYPAGKITCTAQGDKPSGTWNNTAKKIIERLVTAYGEPNTRFTSGDLDTTSLNTFDVANPQTLGIYLSNRENVLSICNKIASTVGSRLVMTRDGKLKLVKIELPASGTPFIITDADVITGSLYISRKLEVKAGVKLAYCKNWSVQENLDTRIPSSHKVLHSQEWLVTVARDNTVKSDYRIDGEPEQEETFFLTEAHASTEATRLLNLFKTIRYIVTFKATARLFQLQLGQAVTLTYSRFGLDAGKSGMVVGLSPDWDRGLIDVEVFV
ncbi:MAG: hypothetical protein KIT80_23320 [Chitinophagaceae bacterium]|nr:hypothetical protein [Nitrosomonas sp.]MCW5929870.1 hypothetical protein [Chitinophagaceae bacterium]